MLKQRPGDQPLPTPNDRPDVQSMVIADITARREVGIQRYGTALQAFNGRDALRDAYEEAMDLTMYLRQAIEERTDPAVAGERCRLLEILDLPIDDDIFGSGTVRGFLTCMAQSAWHDNYVCGESDWRWRLYKPLARAGHVPATFDDEGYIDELDKAAANELVTKFIAFLGEPPAGR